MKATKLLLILLSCMLVVGCKKNNTEDEPTSPTTQKQQYPVITMDTLKQYFPYQMGDRPIFQESDGYFGITYTVNEVTFASKDNKIIASIFMEGIMSAYNQQYKVHIAAEVTDQHLLKTTFSLTRSGQSQQTEGSFEYDTAKDGALPDQFNYSNGAIVEKDKGLTHYIEEEFASEWDWSHTYYNQ